LRAAIERDFGGFDKLKAGVNQAALKVFGSGWATLAMEADGKLAIISHANQDSLFMTHKTPIFGLDVWEHAYYLKHQNRRVEFVDAFFKMVNWDFAAERFAKKS
jgi:Fe-Mn family superoxide dismutase